MKKFFERFVAMALALVMLVSISVPALAADYSCSDYAECTADGAEIYVITKNNCPIREEAHNGGRIVARAEVGQLISVKRVFWTAKMARWCEIALKDGSSLYIHIDNCEPHVHNYVTIVETDNGSVEYCNMCGVAKAEVNGKTATCDITCVADQAIKGSFSEYNPSFASVVGQMIAGELMGPVADVRDLAGDIINGEPGTVIAMDLVAFLPLVGLTKFADEIAILGKHTDDLAGVVKYADEVVSAVSKPNSTKLGENMRKAFQVTGKDRYYDLGDYLFDGKRNVAAHHIVAGGETNKYAKDCQSLLAYAGIDINDAENGVFLVSKAKFSDSAALHSGRHTTEYYKAVHDRLFAAVEQVKVSADTSADAVKRVYREYIVKELDNIAEDLMSGDLLLN